MNATNPEHKHAQAFTIMKYECKSCRMSEKIWNSRDGATPLSIRCQYCGGISYHEDWHLDQYAPDHKPQPGERMFVNLTLDVARESATAHIEKHYPMLQGEEKTQTIREAAASFLGDRCQPHIVEVE